MDYGTKNKRTTAFYIVKEVFDEIDPYQLLEHGAPDDEFESEVEEIVAGISMRSSPARIAKIISRVINKGFKLGTNYRQYIRQGKIIHERIQRRTTNMTKAFSMESELAKALVRFSYGRIKYEQAEAKAKEVVHNFDTNNDVLAHKGLNWYAKQLLKSM